jgi:hypothetical protein
VFWRASFAVWDIWSEPSDSGLEKEGQVQYMKGRK